MSSKINVNPGQYKVAGRERQGEDILQTLGRQKMAQSKVFERFEKNQAAAAQRTQGARPAEEPEAAGPTAPRARRSPASSKPPTRRPAAKRTASQKARKGIASKAPTRAAGTRKRSPIGKKVATRGTAEPQRGRKRAAAKSKPRKR